MSSHHIRASFARLHGSRIDTDYCDLSCTYRSARRGMWKNGLTGETPAEYKKRYAGTSEGLNVNASEASAPEPRPQTRAPPRKRRMGALWQRFLRR